MPVRRAAIVSIPPLLADIVREILSNRKTIEFVACGGRRRGLDKRVSVLSPDIVLIGLRRGETDAIALAILNALPKATVVAISSDVRRASVHKMRPIRCELHDLSKEALIALLSAT